MSDEPAEEAGLQEQVEEAPKEETAEAAEAEVTEEEKPSVPEEEAKPRRRERPEEEEEIVEEKTYTVPLGKAWIMPPRKRTPRATRMLRSYIIKHMKIEVGRKEEEETEEEPKLLVISNEVNQKLWGRGVEKPPRKIRVRAAKDKDGNVTVYLAEGD
jgi:large subunit ribosomal protein L31e